MHIRGSHKQDSSESSVQPKRCSRTLHGALWVTKILDIWFNRLFLKDHNGLGYGKAILPQESKSARDAGGVFMDRYA